MSQLEISEATGLVQPYVSRVENGHTIPGVETLEKWATALKVPLYQILYDGEEPPKPLKISSNHNHKLWGNAGRDSRELKRLRQFLAKMSE
ncbi:MAG TPA: helix-turn-helix transcriptional regulator, partial [Candidatus Dormibacteraeota bacterium]|nr:helix-turn-helix transcriptional regulator [Candidatus Dormibacteraeota bacterium]